MTEEQNKKNKVISKAGDTPSLDRKDSSNKKSKKITSPLRITQVKSPIGRVKSQKETLVGLGLNKINRVALVEDTSSIRGMINKVTHLVRVEKL